MAIAYSAASKAADAVLDAFDFLSSPKDKEKVGTPKLAALIIEQSLHCPDPNTLEPETTFLTRAIALAPKTPSP